MYTIITTTPYFRNFSNFIKLVDTSTGRRSAQNGIRSIIPRVKTTRFYN